MIKSAVIDNRSYRKYKKEQISMKKILSFMLMTAMLLSMLPTWALSVTAEDAERTPLRVEFVSSSSNVQQGETEPKDLSKVFDPTNDIRTGLASSTDVEVIGRLSEPTQITSFVVRSYYYRDRAQGIVVSFSISTSPVPLLWV